MQLEALKRNEHYQSKDTRPDRGDPFGSEALEAGHREDHARYSSQARFYQLEDDPSNNRVSARGRMISSSSSSVTLPPYSTASHIYPPSYPVDQVNGYESDRGRWPIVDARSPTTLRGSSSLVDHGERAVCSPLSDTESYLHVPLPESRSGSATPQMMNRTCSSIPEDGYEAMRSSSRAGFPSPSLSNPQSPYLGARSGTALSSRAGNDTPSSSTTAPKSYPPLSRPGTAITRDDLSGTRQPSFRRAQTPRFGMPGTRAQQAAMNGGVPPSSPAMMSSQSSSPRPEITDPVSLGPHVTYPLEIDDGNSHGQSILYDGVSSPELDAMGSLRVGHSRGWSDSPPLPRLRSRGDDMNTVPLVLRPGIAQP